MVMKKISDLRPAFSVCPARSVRVARLLRNALIVCGAGLAGANVLAAAAIPDTIAQRAAACTACHGKEGRATNDGYFPRIAGKPAGYLYNQLLNFRAGRRTYPMMIYMVSHLSDAYLMEMAQLLRESPSPLSAAATGQCARRGIGERTQTDLLRRSGKKRSRMYRLPRRWLDRRCADDSRPAWLAARLPERAIRRMEEWHAQGRGARLHGTDQQSPHDRRYQRRHGLAGSAAGAHQ